MATMNPFDLLGDDDAEDPLQLVAVQQHKVAAISAAAPKKVQSQPQTKQVAQSQPQAKLPAKLPSKPLPPAEAVRESKNESGRGGGRGGGRGYGRGRGGYRRDSSNNENSFSNAAVPADQGAPEDGDTAKSFERHGYSGPRVGFRGGRHGGFTNGEVGDGERPRRPFERRSGTGRGNEIKREGSGRGNWGTQNDEITQASEEVINEGEKNLGDEKPVGEDEAGDGNKESSANDPEEKKPQEKEMTLEEYEKKLEEKRRALQALKKAEERKVDAKEFESMLQLSSKKGTDDVFIKLGSDKDKRKEAFDKDEKAKKSVTINEFLKPAEGERYFNPGGRGRGRGRGSRGFGNTDAMSNVVAPSSTDAMSNVVAPSIEDRGEFPTLGGK
ncbi:hypothetical protein JCGZ_14637 [Jatropha curcas]|uniref:Hyaluronan/mRNA-binding protein domain-containing protein n=1 Tax=Jatropha curcas TaxID=180498 RepID=A0A067JY23_JATCU|nr:RGG repeats nuclear RNA binding protein A [Jatropha curcas]KDP28866.1 hypothetical protein JCGZ_14637 [Jatropha curcas]